MPVRTYIFLLLACLPVRFFSQNNSTVEVKGVVVEVSDGIPRGVFNVTVSTPSDYDVTDENGNFTLLLNPDEDYVILSLSNCPHPMISPYAGRVNLPPARVPLEVRVCARANEKLRAKVDELDEKVKKLEKSRQLDQRQLERLHQTMVDTIIFYETQIREMTQELDEKNVQLAEKQREIASLERKLTSLEQQLFEALEEKYLRQQKALKSITEGLNAYRSRLKDVHKELSGISDCFLHPQGCDNFYMAARKYSEIRNTIDETHDANVEAVAHYWESSNLASQLNDTYAYILTAIHEPVMFNRVNERVLDPLKNYAAGKKGRIASKNEAEKGAEEALQLLDPLIAELDQKIDQVIKNLTETI